MRAYSIFDDFGEEPKRTLEDAGIRTTIHPKGMPRPDYEGMKAILEEYDCVLIGTSQKMPEEMFDNIHGPKIIGTASVGLDHICVPEEKKELVRIFNTPRANARSVAEYTIGCALACCKRLEEGSELFLSGKNNKALSAKPEDLAGKTMGVIGAGNVSVQIMQYAAMLGMNVIFWTRRPEKHADIEYRFRELEDLAAEADVISVNLPNNEGTRNLISARLIERMKPNCIFISVSRLSTIDLDSLISRAQDEKSFYVNVDIDPDENVRKSISGKKHVFVTPHIAGGTVETRKRMFQELAGQISEITKQRRNEL